MSITNESRPTIVAMITVLIAVILLGSWAPVANAQCTTCATTTVAATPVTYSVYHPVVAQQPQTGWYLGRWFDRRRAKRQANANAVAPTTYAYYGTDYSVGYAYAAGSQPYTAAYAPASTVTYRPYVTAYAPLTRTVVARPVVQTVYSPVISTGCSSCATPTATLHPVVGACSTCSVASGCSTCSTGISPAAYAAPASSCSGCATTSTGPVYSGGTTNAGIPQAAPQVGPQTPQPSLESQPTTPVTSPYKTNRPPAEDSTDDSIPAQDPTPTPLPEEKAIDTNTTYGAPLQLNPADRSARRLPNRRNQVSVEVRTAVYQKPVSSTPAGTRLTGQSSTGLKQPTQAEINAEGWHSVHH